MSDLALIGLMFVAVYIIAAAVAIFLSGKMIKRWFND